MESTVRKIVTFHHIVEALRTNRYLTPDSVDVAIRWAEFCQKLYRESKDKTFVSQLRIVVGEKLRSVSSVAAAAASSYRLSFDDLDDAVPLVVLTVLRNPFVTKDLFSYVVSKSAECPSSEKMILERIARMSVVSEKLDDAAVDSVGFEVEMTTRFLVELALRSKASGENLFETEEMKSFLRSKFGDILKENGGSEFVVRLLLWINSEEFEIDSEESGEVAQSLTLVFTQLLLNNQRLFHESQDVDLLHRICVKDNRFLRLYVDLLKSGRFDGCSEDTKFRVASLKKALSEAGKRSCLDFFELENFTFGRP